jgi:GcrA cell cycle regulator
MGRERKPRWTEQRTDRLKELIEAGWSSTLIGDLLGVSRNAVIGKAHRLRLIRQKQLSHFLPNPTRMGGRALKRQSPMARWRKENPQESRVPVIPDSLWVDFTALSEDSCRWPSNEKILGAFRFCGCTKIPDSPYCAYHTSVGVVQITNKSSDIVKRLQRDGIPQ